jgi:hypothetical protein
VDLKERTMKHAPERRIGFGTEEARRRHRANFSEGDAVTNRWVTQAQNKGIPTGTNGTVLAVSHHGAGRFRYEVQWQNGLVGWYDEEALESASGAPSRRRRPNETAEPHVVADFKKGDRIMWSDSFLERGRQIDPKWYALRKNERGTVDWIQRDGDVIVQWDNEHNTTVHPPNRLAHATDRVLEETPRVVATTDANLRQAVIDAIKNSKQPRAWMDVVRIVEQRYPSARKADVEKTIADMELSGEIIDVGRDRPRYRLPGMGELALGAPRVVADFNTLDDLTAHAKNELGATHMIHIDDEIHIYFPRRDGTYEKAEVWQKDGYWHAQGPSARAIVQRLPAGAKPIAGHAGRRAAEAPQTAGATEFKHLLFGTRFKFVDPAREGNVGFGRETWTYVKTGHNTYRNPLSPQGRKYEHRISNGNALVIPEHDAGHEASESYSVRDYEAVDNRGRRIAGPSKSYSDMKRAAGTAGVVKFVRPGASEARRGNDTRGLKKAEAAGNKYGFEQIESDHFRDWVYDQLVEASKMDPDQVLPLETKADSMEIAGNMLRQLGWDTRRELRANDIERMTGNGDPAYVDAFYEGFDRALESSKDWLADDLLEMKSQIRPQANEARRRPKAKRSARRKRR